MQANTSLVALREMFKQHDWFYDVGLDEFDRLVVYTHRMDLEIMKSIPLSMGDRRVLCQFAASKLVNKDLFIQKQSLTTFAPPSPTVDNEPDNYFMDVLIDQISYLEAKCGKDNLEDIFYEIHDGKNAITNVSKKYPQIRLAMEKLYSEFGFDVMYDLFGVEA